MSDRSFTITTIVVYGKSVGVPTIATIASTLRPFVLNLEDRQLHSIQSYVAMLMLWNEKVSLTSITNTNELLARHFGESFFVRDEIGGDEQVLADIGTGAGFPGLALKIVRPNLEIHLIEQNAKKAAFLAEVVRLLAFERVYVHKTAYEALSPETPKFDFVVARALGNYKGLLKWSSDRLEAKNGRALLWLGADEARRLNEFPGWTWKLPRPIPESQQRVILVGRPTRK
ncbi:MAG TPA: 16S rRNA (guanine(527)-N(7))-methyltransferase RsmG [Candidatus Acidoferrales bacterium]|nr:16S rRNA (guanine(527)-N(7))-methyltransferase RsmG [Candidatus Acidoferrales bacterium]